MDTSTVIKRALGLLLLLIPALGAEETSRTPLASADTRELAAPNPPTLTDLVSPKASTPKVSASPQTIEAPLEDQEDDTDPPRSSSLGRSLTLLFVASAIFTFQFKGLKYFDGYSFILIVGLLFEIGLTIFPSSSRLLDPKKSQKQMEEDDEDDEDEIATEEGEESEKPTKEYTYGQWISYWLVYPFSSWVLCEIFEYSLSFRPWGVRTMLSVLCGMWYLFSWFLGHYYPFYWGVPYTFQIEASETRQKAQEYLQKNYLFVLRDTQGNFHKTLSTSQGLRGSIQQKIQKTFHYCLYLLLSVVCLVMQETLVMWWNLTFVNLSFCLGCSIALSVCDLFFIAFLLFINVFPALVLWRNEIFRQALLILSFLLFPFFKWQTLASPKKPTNLQQKENKKHNKEDDKKNPYISAAAKQWQDLFTYPKAIFDEMTLDPQQPLICNGKYNLIPYFTTTITFDKENYPAGFQYKQWEWGYFNSQMLPMIQHYFIERGVPWGVTFSWKHNRTQHILTLRVKRVVPQLLRAPFIPPDPIIQEGNWPTLLTNEDICEGLWEAGYSLSIQKNEEEKKILPFRRVANLGVLEEHDLHYFLTPTHVILRLKTVYQTYAYVVYKIGDVSDVYIPTDIWGYFIPKRIGCLEKVGILTAESQQNPAGFRIDVYENHITTHLGNTYQLDPFQKVDTPPTTAKIPIETINWNSQKSNQLDQAGVEGYGSTRAFGNYALTDKGLYFKDPFQEQDTLKVPYLTPRQRKLIIGFLLRAPKVNYYRHAYYDNNTEEFPTEEDRKWGYDYEDEAGPARLRNRRKATILKGQESVIEGNKAYTKIIKKKARDPNYIGPAPHTLRYDKFTLEDFKSSWFSEHEVKGHKKFPEDILRLCVTYSGYELTQQESIVFSRP